MKVLHIISGLRVGGAETQLYNLVKKVKINFVLSFLKYYRLNDWNQYGWY